ncbi:NAD-dependent dehydratase, partial [bacterium]|nr:NAD-dependent dehydratase [bacterium]
LLDLTRALKEISESDREPKFEHERVGDIKHSLADNSRLRTLLKVTPEVAFADGLRRLWDYD